MQEQHADHHRKSSRIDGILAKVVGFAFGGSSVSTLANAREESINSGDLLRNQIIYQLLYGAAILTLFLISLIVSCVSDASDDETKLAMIKRLFAGKKLDYGVSAVCSLVSSILLFAVYYQEAEQRNPFALTASGVLGAFSGYVAAGGGSHLPGAIGRLFSDNADSPMRRQSASSPRLNSTVIAEATEQEQDRAARRIPTSFRYNPAFMRRGSHFLSHEPDQPPIEVVTSAPIANDGSDDETPRLQRGQ